MDIIKYVKLARPYNLKMIIDTDKEKGELIYMELTNGVKIIGAVIPQEQLFDCAIDPIPPRIQGMWEALKQEGVK